MRRVFFEVRFATTVTIFLLTATVAAASDRPSGSLAFSQPAVSPVLVMPFAPEAEGAAPGGAGATMWLSEAAAILLTDNLSRLGVPVLGRDERVAVFDRLQLPMSHALTRATLIRVGELIGASEIVFGEVRLGQKVAVRARVIRIGTGAELPGVSDAAPLGEIFELFERLAERITTTVGRPIPAAHKRLAPLPLEAFESYVKGLIAATPAGQQRFLETAMTLAPHDARVLLALWDVYMAQGAHEKALAAANAAAADASYARKARFAVALSLVELRRYDGAFKALSMLFADQPAAPISNAIGVVQLRRGAVPAGTGSAPSYFNRAADAEPSHTDYLFNLGYAHALAGDAMSALFWLRETVRYNAADGDAHLVMSAVLAAAGRQVEAQREFDLARLLGTSLELAGSTPSPKVPAGLERIEADLDVGSTLRLEAAIANPAQRDQRETAAFHLARGRRLVEERKDREAINELRRAVYLAPYEDEPHLLLGELYQHSGRVAEAIDEFKVAIWSRESARARIALGTALLETGDKEGARREAERALVLQPDSAAARDLMKKIGG